MKCAFLVLLMLATFLPIVPAQEKSLFSSEAWLTPPSNCGETLSHNYTTAVSGGGNFTFNVTAPANCTYSVTSNNLPWLFVTSPDSASGNSTVTFTVTSNQSLSNPRVGVIVVGGKTFTVNQNRAKGVGARRSTMDFNGDRTTDFIALQNTNGNMTWWSYRYHIGTGGSTSVETFGLFDTDVPVPNDFDGDLRADFAVWRPGANRSEQAYFYVFQSQTNTLKVFPWGLTGDNPNITQDFDGDFKADFAVTRKQKAKLVWYIYLSATNKVWIQQFGNETDKAIRGDYDGDFRADLAVYRPNTDVPANTFYALKSASDTVIEITFGLSDIDKIVPGDYNGDNITDFAVWRTTTGVWYWTNGFAVNSFHFGLPGDLPVPGDYNDDGATDYAVWRPDAGQSVFYIKNTGGFNMISTVHWGNSTMKVPAYSMQVQ